MAMLTWSCRGTTLPHRLTCSGPLLAIAADPCCLSCLHEHLTCVACTCCSDACKLCSGTTAAAAAGAASGILSFQAPPMQPLQTSLCDRTWTEAQPVSPYALQSVFADVPFGRDYGLLQVCLTVCCGCKADMALTALAPR